MPAESRPPFRPLWARKDLSSYEHRLLWWLIDVGAIGKTVEWGWKVKCASTMGVHRSTVDRLVRSLVRKGVLQAPDRGVVRFDPAAFDSNLPAGFVRFRE